MIPPEAIQVWKDGDSIAVSLDSHEVRIRLRPWEWLAEPKLCPQGEGLSSCPPGGLRTLALLLKQRERFQDRTISSNPSPTQWNIDTGTLSDLDKAELRAKRALERKALAQAKTDAAATEEAKIKALVKNPKEFLKAIGLWDEEDQDS